MRGFSVGRQPDFVKRQQDEPMRLANLPAGTVADVKCGASFNVALLKDGWEHGPL